MRFAGGVVTPEMMGMRPEVFHDAEPMTKGRGPMVFPHQATQHLAHKATGNYQELEWQYPFFRQDLVDQGLLSPRPPGGPENVTLPPGVSVLQAIRSGLIR